MIYTLNTKIWDRAKTKKREWMGEERKENNEEGRLIIVIQELNCGYEGKEVRLGRVDEENRYI